MKATGYELVRILRLDAEECANPNRAQLLSDAADEIAKLIEAEKAAVRANRKDA